MHRVEPKIELIAKTVIDEDGLKNYLDTIGAVTWESDADSGVEEIVEVMGRACYKSFGVGLNPNITKVREGNTEYIKNIIKSQHGSVLEHAWVSFMFTEVSRVFTHELVRHRVGVAISQESLRYVRLENLGLWIPSCFNDKDKFAESYIQEAERIFEEAFNNAENSYTQLLYVAARMNGYENFDDIKSFDLKKKYTSAARRVAPIGLATAIGWSCNMRTLRHTIEMRTARHAEEEIRLVFASVANHAQSNWPALFGDMTFTIVDGIPEYTTPYRKI